MRTKPTYLVIRPDARGGPRISRATQLWPSLEGGEIVVRVVLEIPDELLPNVQELVVSAPDAVAIAVSPEPIEADDVEVLS